MPKEEPCLSEASPSAASNKNAKDKGNHATLLTICETKNTAGSSERGSHCSSEKDSGYSDTGSDWQQTDVENPHGDKSQSGGSKCAASSHSDQKDDLREDNQGSPTLAPVKRDLKPLYMIRNMVLKQPDIIQNRGQVLWTHGNRGGSVSGTSHVIMVQPASLVPATLQLHKSLSHKSNLAGKKTSGTYLPILNSYPRIAPHPSKKPPDKSSSNDDDSQNMSKRFCTEYKSDNTTVIRCSHEQHIHKQPKLSGTSCGQPDALLSPTTDNLTSPSSTNVSSSQASSSASTPLYFTTRGLHRNIVINTRHRHLHNAIEILKKSGLLDITLRTKELLHQSNATERDIAQLRQHTELLYHTASTNPNSITAWESLRRVMAESHSYPSLSNYPTMQTPHTHSEPSNNQERIREDDRENSDMSRRDLPTVANRGGAGSAPQQCQPDQSSDKPPDKVTFTPPDSSTG